MSNPLQAAGDPNFQEMLGVGSGHHPGPVPIASAYSGFFGGLGTGASFGLGPDGRVAADAPPMLMPGQMYWDLLHREANVRAREDTLRRREWEALRSDVWSRLQPALIGAAVLAVIGALVWLGWRGRG